MLVTSQALPREVPVPPLLRAEDHSHGLLATREARGELIRVARGIYTPQPDRAAPAWRRNQQVQTAKALAVGSTLPASTYIGLSHAALLLGCPVSVFPEKVQCFSQVATSATRGPVLYQRNVAANPPLDLIDVAGAWVTGYRQTALDCARLLPPQQSVPIVDALLRRAARVERWDEASLARAEDIRSALLDRLFQCRGLRGTARARVVLTYADARAESTIESEARRLVLVLGLPRPELQRSVRVAGRDVYPDMTWVIETPAGTVVVVLETDGMEKYLGDQEALIDERERARLLESVGCRVVRLTTRQIRSDGLYNLRTILLPQMPQSVLKMLSPVRGLMTDWEAQRLGSRRTAGRHNLPGFTQDDGVRHP